MDKCPECKKYLMSYEKKTHKCNPIWEIMPLSDYEEHGDDDGWWSEQRGFDAEEALESYTSDDSEFTDGDSEDYIVKNPRTGELIKLNISAYIMLEYKIEEIK